MFLFVIDCYMEPEMYENNIQLYATLVPVSTVYSWGGSFSHAHPQ